MASTSARVLRITDIYDHPDLFAFRQEEAGYPDNAYFKRNYPRDPGGRQWEYWFASPDASEQLLICWVIIKNGTDHILRMRDARIYLVAEGRDPMPAMGGVDGPYRRPIATEHDSTPGPREPGSHQAHAAGRLRPGSALGTPRGFQAH